MWSFSRIEFVSTQVKHNEVMQMGDKLWYMESLRGVTLYQVENRYMDQLLW